MSQDDEKIEELRKTLKERNKEYEYLEKKKREKEG